MILITGSTGYMGSQICKKFEKLKIKYIGINNLKYTYREDTYNKKKFINFITELKVKNFVFFSYTARSNNYLDYQYL
mgnify:FL=1